MKCIIVEKESDIPNSNGEAKEITVLSYSWMENGESGTSYTYQMSKEKYTRDINKIYEIYLNQEGNTTNILVSVMHYYDFVDFQINDCIGERKIDYLANQLHLINKELIGLIYEQLEPLKRRISEEFMTTEEYKKKVEHQEILQRYKEAKKQFGMKYGTDTKNYDRCYNVFGQLMNEQYLNKLNDERKKREDFQYDSKNYRKKSYQYFSTNMYTSNAYDESEKIILEKFYKTLAKRFHPDANPDIDTSDEMKLLNKLKREWRI